MLRTSSGDRAAEEAGWELAAGSGLAAVVAAAWAATMPGARFARGTRRGMPALIVWTEAAWSVAAAGWEAAAAPSAAAAGWAGAAGGRGRSGLTRSAPGRRLARPGG